MQELHGLVSSDRRVPASVALVTRREGQLLEAEATVPSSGVGAGRLSPTETDRSVSTFTDLSDKSSFRRDSSADWMNGILHHNPYFWPNKNLEII